VGTPSTAGVIILDDDIPPTPKNLRVNGHLKNGKITLRWDAVQDAASYNVRYIQEVCGEPGTCYLLGTRMVQEDIPTKGTSTIEADFSGLATAPIEKNTLYRIDVQAVIVDDSEWSDFAGAYPTDAPLPYAHVAGNEIWSHQSSKNLTFDICKTTANPFPKGITDASDLADALETWETAVRWRTGGKNIITMTGTEQRTCPAVGAERSNQILFLNLSTLDSHCPPPFRSAVTLACWPKPRGFPLGSAQDPTQSMLLLNHPQQDWTSTNLGDCTQLHYVVAHEAGHALGLDHNGYIHSLMVTRYRPESMECGPTPHDVVGIMANYQSR
jgi:hypothetical protein